MAASYTFEDYSGAATSLSDNPYDGLIETCHNDPKEIQSRYDTHRTARTEQQKKKLLSAEFEGVVIDQILKRLEDPLEPDYKDPRHCLVFWARPPQEVKEVIAEVQRRLKTVAPNLWTMPQSSLHMTALEITHSLTAPEINALVSQIEPHMAAITDYSYENPQCRARLVKPSLSFDAQALALSFLPAAGEDLPSASASEGRRTAEADTYTYHHLRRDLFSMASATGVKVASRYVVPSAHLTVARFIESKDFETADGEVDGGKVAELVEVIEGINQWLKEEFWPVDGEEGKKKGLAWVVGEEKGFDSRQGALWYGSGGETVRLGKGF
ncbi:hypothetical protein AAFC00_001180 [Neodothiora populina]|uniref:RNA ligase/cyclic nucleotide phosphodiesterase n=1 Tax=Neodothiora populina TaxID=2781224 RepID=A0ABR3PP25_9PEZI